MLTSLVEVVGLGAAVDSSQAHEVSLSDDLDEEDVSMKGRKRQRTSLGERAKFFSLISSFIVQHQRKPGDAELVKFVQETIPRFTDWNVEKVRKLIANARYSCKVEIDQH